MKVNFDERIDRSGTSASKWDSLETLYGRKDVIPLWVADMEFLSPQPVREALVKRAQHGVFGYTLRSDSFLESIVEWQGRRHNWHIQKEWVSHTPGVVTALSIAVLAFTNPGDKVIIQSPVYPPFYAVIEKQGREVALNPLQFEGSQYKMDFEQLESTITNDTKMLILCSPHNPTGRVWTKEELHRLGEICLKNDILIVSDEIHNDLVFKDYTHTPIAALSHELANQCITCIAPSKTFNVAGLHTSFTIISNESLKKRYDREIVNTFIGGANIFGVVAAEAAYRGGDAWLEQVIDYVQGNLDYVTGFIKENIPQIHVIPPEGTYLVWLDCRELGMTPKELKRFMIHDAGLALNDGRTFGPGGEGFQRMNIACQRLILEKALQQLADAVHSHQATTTL